MFTGHHGRRTAFAVLALSVTMASTACTGSPDEAETPGLEDRGVVMTTVKPERQDLTNRVALTGKVEINPVFGIAAPANGEVRYLSMTPADRPATAKTWVASVWSKGTRNRVFIPPGSTLAGRLLADRSPVTSGMPIVSATYAGYGIVAEIDGAQAYRIADKAGKVQAQITNGPGPFACKTLGTLAALPPGSFPEPEPADPPAPDPNASAAPQPVPEAEPAPPGSESTGMRLVCTPPAGTKLINGAAVTLDVVTDEATGVLVLPVEAVAGSQGKGKVDIVGPDRTRQTVDVELGLTDGKMVQIKKGLKGTEEIAVPGPDLPVAPPGAGDPSGPVG